MRDLVIVGIGGVGRALKAFVADVNGVEERWRLRGFVDDDENATGKRIGGLPVMGPVSWLQRRSNVDVLLGLGDPCTRRHVAQGLKSFPGLSFPALVHPQAYVAADVPIGAGVIIYPGACIDPDVCIGNFVLVNKNATVGHDTVLGDFTTLAPGASVGGAVQAGEGVSIGIGAACRQGLQLGDWSVVGAGAGVVHDVRPGATVVGVPAREIKEK